MLNVIEYLLSVLVLVGVENSKPIHKISSQEFVVEGSTSIGDFKCTYSQNGKNIFIINTSDNRQKVVFDLPLREFGCGNFLLTGDFRKTIKAKEFPFAKVELFNFQERNSEIITDMHLNIAGKQKVYKNVPLLTNGKQLRASVVINFQEFDLSAPSKMGGIVKVKDEIQLSVVLLTN